MAWWCAQFEVSRQAYYQYGKQVEKQMFEDELIMSEVDLVRTDLPQSGFRQILPIIRPRLANLNISVGRDHLLDLLRDAGKLIKQRRAGAKTTNSNHSYFVYENLHKGVEINRLGQMWVCDITYISTREGFLYLSLITDAFTRKIVGFHAADTLELEGCLLALQSAIAEMPRGFDFSTLTHHSDRGVQYCSKIYTKLLQDTGIHISMAATGNCYENAQAESMNGILKREFLLDSIFVTKVAAHRAITDAIRKYNTIRPHGQLESRTPHSVHQQALDALKAKI
jgi:putative transposase